MPSENQVVTSSENASTCFNTLHRQYVLICCDIFILLEMLVQIILNFYNKKDFSALLLGVT